MCIRDSCREALTRHTDLLNQRAQEGKVRRGHGDLHLRNICLFKGEPLLFDCLEFDEDLATVDVLYDLAFVLMDLWHRNLEVLANLLFNRYLDAVDDERGIRLLPFFMAVRAAVRAHVVAVDTGRSETDRLTEARAYLDLCRRLLKSRPPDVYKRQLPGGAPRQIGNPVRSAANSAGRLDWHNELSSLILDIDEQMSLAADGRGRKQIIRRLRRALSSE